MLSAQLRGAGRWLALAATPVFFLLLASQVRIPVPGNAHHEDPDWYYLANSAALGDGKGVHLMQHPGMPLSAGGAVLMRLKAFLAPESPELPFAEEVLLHTPAYHWYLGNVLLGATALALLAFGLVLARRMPLGAALACQLLLVLTPMQLEFAGRWIPEGFALLFGACAGALLFLSAGERPNRALAPALGALAGLASSVKLYYFPWLLFTFARGLRKAPAALAAAALTFGAFLLVLRHGFAENMFRYFYWMATRKGMYAGGEPGVPDLCAHIVRLYGSHPHLIWQLACMVAFSGLALASSLRRKGNSQRTVLFLLFATIVLNVAGQAKHPAARYSLPALAMLPTLFAVVWLAERERWARGVASLCVALTIAVGAAAWMADLRSLIALAGRVGKQEAEIEARLLARPECLQIFHNAVPSHRWANFTASLWSGYQLDREYRNVFPRTWEYDVHRDLFRGHGVGRFAPEAFIAELSKAPCAFFYQRRDLPDPFENEALRERRWEPVLSTPQVELHYSEKLR